MAKNLQQISRLLLLVSALAATAASAVCPDGQIAMGYMGNTPVVVANDCGIIDQKASGDTNLCGVYPGGSTIICNAGGQVPSSAQMTDYSNWGSCTDAKNSSCSSISVKYCCARN